MWADLFRIVCTADWTCATNLLCLWVTAWSGQRACLLHLLHDLSEQSRWILIAGAGADNSSLPLFLLPTGGGGMVCVRPLSSEGCIICHAIFGPWRISCLHGKPGTYDGPNACDKELRKTTSRYKGVTMENLCSRKRRRKEAETPL